MLVVPEVRHAGRVGGRSGSVQVPLAGEEAMPRRIGIVYCERIQDY
jgi:hypothetical protein